MHKQKMVLGKDNKKLKEKGLTLLEALISAAIVGIGFIAVFQMVNYSVQSIGVSGERTKVSYLSSMIVEDLISDRFSAKGPFFSENSMVLKKICQITILNLNFLNYILFVFVLQLIFRLTPLTSVAKKARKFKQRA